MKIEFCCEEMREDIFGSVVDVGDYDDRRRFFIGECPYCDAKIEITVREG